MLSNITASSQVHGAEVVARAVTAMRNARNIGEFARTDAAVEHNPSIGEAKVEHETANERAAPNLATLLARRNALVDTVNALALIETPQEQLDLISATYYPLEEAITDAATETVDDLVTKLAFMAELVRERACPNGDDVTNFLADADFILRRAADPMQTEKVVQREAHWALVPTPAPAPSPSPVETPDEETPLSRSRAAIAALVEDKVALDDPRMAAALAAHGDNWLDRMLGDERVEPAGISAEYAKRRAEALALWRRDLGAGSLADYYAEPTGEPYTDACIAYVELCRQSADAGFAVLRNTRATSLAELWDKEALLGAHSAEESPPDWYRQDVANLVEPPLPPTVPELASIVAETLELAKAIPPAQDAFNEADVAWVKTKGEGEQELGVRREELEGIWIQHLDHFSESAERIFDLPAGSPAERKRLIEAYADLMAPVVCLPDYEDSLQALPRENLLTIIDYLTKDTLAPATSPAWDAAIATFEAKVEALKAARAAEAQAEKALDFAAPMPDILVIERDDDGSVTRSYFTAESIERDFGEPDQTTVREMMLAARDQWQTAHDVAEQELCLTEVVQAREDAFDAWRAAYHVVMELTPPNAAALAYKARMLILDDCFNQEYGDVTAKQLDGLLVSDGAAFVAGKLYQDITALAGAPAPAETDAR